MRLGFLGTGTIARAMIDGIIKAKLPIKKITVSPRNEAIAHALKAAYETVAVASDNQEVVDASDIVFICLRSQIAPEIMQAMEWRREQIIVSFLAMANRNDLEAWSGQTVYRAVPLPFVANGEHPTPLYPPHPQLETIFNALGGTILLDNEAQFSPFMAAGSMMGLYFRILRCAQDWLVEQGLSTALSGHFLAQMFLNLSHEMQKKKPASLIKPVDFLALEREFSTKGGTNEFIAEKFIEEGGGKAMRHAFDQALLKINGH